MYFREAQDKKKFKSGQCPKGGGGGGSRACPHFLEHFFVLQVNHTSKSIVHYCLSSPNKVGFRPSVRLGAKFCLISSDVRKQKNGVKNGT